MSYDVQSCFENGEDSLTVTIALDLPGSEINNKCKGLKISSDDIEADEFSNFLSISMPISPIELISKWQKQHSSLSSIIIRDISQEVSNILALRLSSSSCGSMRNWEFLAACMGLSIDEIVVMRKSENPVCVLLQKFVNEHLLKLLELIGQSGRVDVLLALQPFIGLLSKERKLLNKNNNQQRDQIIVPIHMRTVDSALLSFSSDSLQQNSSTPKGQFILILHHENKNNRELRCLHKMFIKNLERCVTEKGLKVLDVDNCFSGEDLFGSLQRHFERASQILLSLSDDYAETICSDKEHTQELDQRIQLKRSLHQMTFQEVLYNRGENRRFRVIIMNGTKLEYVPRGWPSNTLHYRFPNDFSELCVRLLDGEKEKLNSS